MDASGAASLADCRIDGTGVQAELRDRATGRLERVQAQYLIGADGPRSSVRSMLGLGVEDLGTIGQFVAVTFRADLTRRLPRVPSVLNAVEVAAAAGLFVPTSTDDRWIYGREWHPDRGESIADWTPQRCTEVLRVAHWAARPTPRDPHRDAVRHGRPRCHRVPRGSGVSRR